VKNELAKSYQKASSPRRHLCAIRRKLNYCTRIGAVYQWTSNYYAVLNKKNVTLSIFATSLADVIRFC